MKFIDFLPTTEDSCEAAETLEFHASVRGSFTDDDNLARILPYCPNLHTVNLTGIHDLSDRSLVTLAHTTTHLRYIDISGCQQITDVGVLELASQANRLEVVKLNGIQGLTDPSISALVRSLPRLVELDAADLPLLTSYSVRDIWTFGKKLRKVRLCRCTHADDKGFPSPFDSALSTLSTENARAPVRVVPGKPLLMSAVLGHDIGTLEDVLAVEMTEPTGGNRISSWLDAMPPLYLPAHHILEDMRTLDLTQCMKITDDAVSGIVAHAPRLQHIHLAGCSLLSGSALVRLCSLATHLETLTVSHAEKLTDPAIMDLVRFCPRLANIDVSYCPLLSDLSVLELATLPNLRRLAIASLPLVTDVSLLSLAEHGDNLTHLQIAHCEHITLHTIHILLRRLRALVYLSASGIRATRRTGIKRFSEKLPPHHDSRIDGPYRVFRGDNIARLRQFLDKEELRRREAEEQSIPFRPRGDDSMDLY
ncbi:RNI-like protein [Cytidiella melzeri]|nr:RNI-like protein [Cytidiella melzeri]